MARTLKVVGLLLGALLLIAILYLWFADFSRFKPRIEAAVSEATGREFHINGDFRIDVLPTPGVLVDDATLANADWAENPDMIHVGHFASQVGLWSLVSGPVEIRNLELDDVTVYLETNADGESNTDFGQAAEPPEPEDEEASVEPPAIIQHAEIRNVKIVSSAPGTEPRTFLLEKFDVNGDAERQQFTGTARLDDLPITLEGTAADGTTELQAGIGDVDFTSTTEFAGDTVSFDVSLGTLAEVGKLAGVENLPEQALTLTGRISADGTKLTLEDLVAAIGTLRINVDGTIDTAPTAALTVRAEGESLDLLRPALPKLPFSVETRVDLGESNLNLDPLELRLGESVLTGSVHAGLADAPSLEVNLASPLLDLAPFFPEKPAEEDEAPPAEEDSGEGYVFADEPLPLDLLRDGDADIDIHFDRVRTANTEFADFKLLVTLKDGKLELTNTFAGEYGGTFSNTVTAAATDAGANVDIDLNAGDLKLVALAGSGVDAANIPTSAIDVKLAANGDTPRALAASADGKVLFMQGPGQLDNKLIGKLSGDILAQLFGALNPFAKEEQYSNWECSVFGIDFESGEGSIDSFLLQGDKIMVVGGGEIDLNTEKLNIEFNTKPRKGVGISADMFVTPFVALTGTLSDPRVGLNAKGALLSGGAAILTGGLSFLYKGLADRATAEAGKCEETFEAIGQTIPGGG